ncbi:MAG: hypothetical protein GC179_01550 [Anaerolineaceae bacterium]|nr:hypothetical protein [Anaerolineaceae bacterium]
MESNFIIDIIRRSNRNQLLVWGIGLILVLIAISFSVNQYYNLLAGPFEVDKSYIEAIKDVTQLDKFYVTIKGDKTADTQYYVTNTTNGIETSKYYYKALVLDKNLLLVKTGEVNNQDGYTGALTPIPFDEQREIVDPLNSEAFLPFMLDAGDFRNTGFAGMAAAAIVFLVCLWGILRTVSRVVSHERHPIWRGLERFGEPVSVADQITTEVNSSAQQVGKAQLTSNWLVAAQKSTLETTQLKDIIWIYKKVVNGRGGRRFSALIYDRYGKLTTVTGKEAQVDETLRGLAQRMPWIMVGYSAQTQAAWNKDRANFIAAVDQRKKQASNQ